MTAPPVYASPTDVETYGQYRILRGEGEARPLYRFSGRITADGSSGFRAEVGRYHLYAGWSCPWAQRITIQRALNGLEDVVSLSYVDGSRDARGWAFRETHGPDPVNGFTLLRQAYEATEPGFDGHVSVPALWDRQTGRIVSNDFHGIGIDLATQFRAFVDTAPDTYPDALRAQIETLDRWLGPTVNRGVGAAAAGDPVAGRRLGLALADLDSRLARQRYLLDDRVTEADVRLFVTLVRYDRVTEHPNLWAYARDLYQQPAFRATTDFTSFTAPDAELADWDAPHERHLLASAA